MADSSAQSPPPLLAAPFLRWLVRLAALGAGGIGLWLTIEKLTGRIDSIAGCGGAGGCSQVLGGRWSAWMGVPVSALAFVFYAVVLGLTFRPVYSKSPFKIDALLTAAALAALLAACWFLGLLVVVEKTFCPFCAAVHALGFLWAVPVLWRRASMGKLRGAPGFAVAAGVAVLILGQLFGPAPQTYLLTTTPASPSPAAPPASAPVTLPAGAASPPGQTAAPAPGAAAGSTAAATPAPAAAPVPVPAAREISFQNGTMYFRTDELPILGPKDAAHVMVEYFDYTCASCRDMSKDMEAARAQLGGRIAVIVLACPLNRQCNSALPDQVPDHAGACTLARLSLAVWRKAPQQFEAYHQFLMALPLPPDETAARTRATEICGGADGLTLALADPWIEGRLNQTVQEYASLCVQQIKMPKLLLHGNVMMHGTARSAEQFIATLRQQFGF
ncbi:MAG: vitamin K epoxide reductase family protein [Verrucomicrobiota bacterium]